HRSEQTCALGAAMFATTAAGIYPDVQQAMQTMGQGFDMEYKPDAGPAGIYQRRYQRYLALGKLLEKNPVLAREQMEITV
ncbi:MAG TPA: hypothetical protein VK666_15900, partial [Chryseolinea sp.]|nr:hypothetical protein [Chryseolinea sp.]